MLVATRQPALVAGDLDKAAERIHECARDIEARSRMIGVSPNSGMGDLFTDGELKWLRYSLNSAAFAVTGVIDAIDAIRAAEEQRCPAPRSPATPAKAAILDAS